jgi:hypothetical protein
VDLAFRVQPNVTWLNNLADVSIAEQLRVQVVLAFTVPKKSTWSIVEVVVCIAEPSLAVGARA